MSHYIKSRSLDYLALHSFDFIATSPPKLCSVDINNLLITNIKKMFNYTGNEHYYAMAYFLIGIKVVSLYTFCVLK